MPPPGTCPLKIIAEEAGGLLQLRRRASSTGNCVICVPALEPELRAFVAGGKR
jgi:hypothetical protein